MMKRLNLISCLSVCLAAGAWVRGDDIPPHPGQLRYPELHYNVPPASGFRSVLTNGVVVYIAEDRLLPTFDMSITLRTGAAVEPADKAGLASLTGDQMRDGGTKTFTPEEFDERAEYLAASLFSGIGDTRGRAGLSCLSKDIDEGLSLLIEMLRYPRFDEERLRQSKERRIQNIKRRNDSTASIGALEWGFLMNGEEHFSNRHETSASIRAIAHDDLAAFHRKYIHPSNMTIAVAGDFVRDEMLKKLEKAFGDWAAGETGPTTFPAPSHTPKSGVYLMHKDGVNQGRVSIGHKSILRGSPDEFALQIMNGILGAGGFRSRLFAKVRSDEGLAYNTGSRFDQGVYYPGEFMCWFQSKSNSCAYAAKIVLGEIAALRDQPVTQPDVDDAVSYYVESFPQRFPTKMALLETYVDDEYTGRNPDYWRSYLDNLRKVTPSDVRRVAQKYLHPDQLVILAVGDAEAVLAGGHAKSPDVKFDGFGPVTRLPLRDPDTLRR